MRGVIYLATTKDFFQPLTVSIASLRRFHDLPITIRTREKYVKYIEHLADVEPIDLAEIGWSNNPIRRTWHTKIQAYRESPYRQTVYLDADTLIRGDISELFSDQLTLTQIGDRTKGGRPMVNCGVMGFGSDRSFFDDVERYALAKHVHDQKAIQALYPDGTRILSERYNLTSRRFGKVEDPLIVHFVGRRWKIAKKYSGEWLQLHAAINSHPSPIR